jgi:hypothetical protein
VEAISVSGWAGTTKSIENVPSGSILGSVASLTNNIDDLNREDLVALIKRMAEEIEKLRKDIPAVPAPVVTQYAVPVCRCRNCGRIVRGQADGLAPDQYGATAHRLGPRVKAVAHMLHYGLGIPVRKLPQVLWEMAGLFVFWAEHRERAVRADVC